MLLEYQLDWIKIVDFLLIAKFWASPDNYDSPSMSARSLWVHTIRRLGSNKSTRAERRRRHKAARAQFVCS